jgi:hypothetical protein
MFQGFSCSEIKMLLELGLNRRETGWMLSSRIVLNIEGTTFLYERIKSFKPIVFRLFCQKQSRVATFIINKC